jgi:hypothetical protein
MCKGEIALSALLNFSGEDPGAMPQAGIYIAPCASTYRRTAASGRGAVPTLSGTWQPRSFLFRERFCPCR